MLNRIVFACLWLFLCPPIIRAGELFISKKGFLNLSTYNYYSNNPVKLNGEWLFVWNEFNKEISNQKNITFIQVPGHWNVSKGTSLYKNQFGYCTYSLKILLPEANQMWSLYLPPIHSAYRIYINDSLMDEVGKPSVNKSMTPKVLSQIVSFRAPTKELTITIQVSNYYFVFGGILTPISFGNPKSIQANTEHSLIISGFLIGSLLIMGLYHLALFILRKKDKEFIYFSIICIFIALRESFGGEALFYSFFPTIDYELSIKLLYAVFPICLIAFILFFSSLYSSFSHYMKIVAIIIASIFLLIIVFTTNTFYGKYLPIISTLFLLEALYLTILIIKKTYERPRENLLILIGVLILIACFINDVLFEAEVINSYFLLPFGFFVFTLFQSIMLSVRFTNAFRKSEFLSIELLKSQMAYNEMQSNFQKELLQSQLETQEYTFNQISQELHDNIGQLLSSTKLLLGIASMEMKTVPDTIKTAEQTVAKAIIDLRSLSKSLNKEWLHQFNLIENLQAEKERINAARNIKVELISQYEKLPLEPDAQVMLFRVVQEALQNSIKHSFAKHIIIQIKNTDNHFELSIEDDGRGFDIEAAKKESLGLRNMEHRTALLGGTIEWKLVETKGTVITIRIPIKEEA